MTLTIEVPEKLIAEAEARGVPVVELVRERLEPENRQVHRHKEVPADFDWDRVAGAVQRIRENSMLSTLGPDVTIKQLIEEGRRY
jgi:ATP-dependent exoDNAse (exonuclease V) alpha subunit